MPTLLFSTPTTLDLRLLTTFGASVKTGPSPIGKFGTGLKYALAGTLRLGGEIRIKIGGTMWEACPEDEIIRGKSFTSVFLRDMDNIEDPVRLPFTLDLGAHWEPWMIYREFLSNTLDEDGEVLVVEDGESVTLYPDSTGIFITSPIFLEVHQTRSDFWLQPPFSPLLSEPGVVEILPGPNRQVFFNGIKVSNNPPASLPYVFTWNLKGDVDLSEDRLLSAAWAVEREMVGNILEGNEEVWQAIIEAEMKGNHREWKFDYDIGGRPSEAFSAFWLARLHDRKPLPTTIRSLLKKWKLEEYQSAAALEIPDGWEAMVAGAPEPAPKVTESYYTYARQTNDRIVGLEKEVAWWKACAKKKWTGEETRIEGEEKDDGTDEEIPF